MPGYLCNPLSRASFHETTDSWFQPETMLDPLTIETCFAAPTKVASWDFWTGQIGRYQPPCQTSVPPLHRLTPALEKKHSDP